MQHPLTAPHRPRRPVAHPGWTIPWSPEVALAFLSLFALGFQPMLGGKGVLLFLLGGAGLIALRPGAFLAALRQEWLVVLMALWCLMSFAWSDYPSLTIRHGAQLILTIAVVLAICQRLAPMTFVKIMLLTQGAAMLVSLASGRTRVDGQGFLGIYGSKNALSGASSLLIILSVAVLTDRRIGRVWRLLAGLGLVLGTMLMLMGKSTGALVATAAVIMTFGLIVLLQRLKPTVRLVSVIMALVLMAAVGIVLYSMADTLAEMFLKATGKDLTLTGRTELWQVAFGEIAKRPWLGAGFQAVWVPGNPVAEAMWAKFGIRGKSGFHFHNTLISNAVEIGLIGIALQAAVFFGALARVLAWAIRAPSAASIFFALFMVRQLSSMGVEVVFFFQFDLSTVMTVAAVFYGHRFSQASRVRWVRRRSVPMPSGPGLPVPRH